MFRSVVRTLIPIAALVVAAAACGGSTSLDDLENAAVAAASIEEGEAVTPSTSGAPPVEPASGSEPAESVAGSEQASSASNNALLDSDYTIGDAVPWTEPIGDAVMDTTITEVSCGLEVLGLEEVADGEFCVVALEGVVVSGDSVALYPLGDIALVTDQGRFTSEPDDTMALTSSVFLGMFALDPGESDSQRLAFDIPEGATVLGVALPDDVGTVALPTPITTVIGQSAEAQLAEAASITGDTLAAFEAFAASGDSLVPEDFGDRPLPGCRDIDLDVVGAAVGFDYDRKSGREVSGVSPARSCALYDGTNDDTWDNLVNFKVAPVDEAESYVFSLGSDEDLIAIDVLDTQAWWGNEGSLMGGYTTLKVVEGGYEFRFEARTIDDRGLSAEQMLAGMQAMLTELNEYEIPGGDGIVDSCGDLAPVELGASEVSEFTPTRFDNSLACFAETAGGDRIHVVMAEWDRSPFYLEGVLEDLRPFDGPDPVIDVTTAVSGVDEAWRIDDTAISTVFSSNEIFSDEIFGLAGTQFVSVALAGPIVEGDDNEALLVQVLEDVLG